MRLEWKKVGEVLTQVPAPCKQPTNENNKDKFNHFYYQLTAPALSPVSAQKAII